MDEPTPLPEPGIDDIVGHVFDGIDVYIVFRDADSRQFWFIPETGERWYGTYLEEGQTWRPPAAPCPDGYCDRQKAIHEAGHAVICADEGIRVEYVTVLPSSGTDGEQLLGQCRYDYRLGQQLKADPQTWGPRAVKANLGGQEAECIYLERSGGEVTEQTRARWRNDSSAMRKQVAASFGWDVDKFEPAQLKAPCVLNEIERLRELVATRLSDPAIWRVVEAVANLLVRLGAIEGRVVSNLLADSLGTN